MKTLPYIEVFSFKLVLQKTPIRIEYCTLRGLSPYVTRFFNNFDPDLILVNL